jgi:hypothetical protein
LRNRDFLDDLIDPLYAHQTDQTETTSRRLNAMIATALITSEERNRLESIAYKISEAEALALCEKLKDSMPQVGYHTIPHSVEDFGKAIRYAVDKDDYYNDNRSKNIQSES